MQSDSTFWISLAEMLKMFKYLTVNHSDPTYYRRTFSADIEGPDAPEGGLKNKQWGIMHVKMKMHYPFGFFRIYQLDTMHLDRSDSTQEEYPEM
jgi:hypothetical protein